MKVDLSIFASGSDVDVEEMDDAEEVGVNWVVENEESLGDENLSLEGDDNLSFGLLLDDGIRMAL